MVEGDGLENRWARFGSRGFKSHPLRSLARHGVSAVTGTPSVRAVRCALSSSGASEIVDQEGSGKGLRHSAQSSIGGVDIRTRTQSGEDRPSRLQLETCRGGIARQPMSLPQ